MLAAWQSDHAIALTYFERAEQRERQHVTVRCNTPSYSPSADAKTSRTETG
jgi:hypothetical protein